MGIRSIKKERLERIKEFPNKYDAIPRRKRLIPKAYIRAFRKWRLLPPSKRRHEKPPEIKDYK